MSPRYGAWWTDWRQPMKLALKVDVDTYRGTLEGVPRLVELLRCKGAGATFLFSLGPDHTGRAVRRVFRPGFMRTVSRTSVLEHYGLRTLLYGTLLPGPDIGRRCADRLREVADRGFETGILSEMVPNGFCLVNNRVGGQLDARVIICQRQTRV